MIGRHSKYSAHARVSEYGAYYTVTAFEKVDCGANSKYVLTCSFRRYPKLNARLTYRAVCKVPFGPQSVIDSIANGASATPKLAKNIKPPNVAIIMPTTCIVRDMAGALKLRSEQGDSKSLYVFWQNLVSMTDATAYHARPVEVKKKKTASAKTLQAASAHGEVAVAEEQDFFANEGDDEGEGDDE
jgi:hypothetical protein